MHGPQGEALALHRDGQGWSPGEIPNGSGEITQLVTDGGRVWGLGDALNGVPYVATLEGPSWQLVPGPGGPSWSYCPVTAR